MTKTQTKSKQRVADQHEGKATGGFYTVITREEFDSLFESQRFSLNKQDNEE